MRGLRWVDWGMGFQILDEKSLIKKYQKEISDLKDELTLLKQTVGPTDDLAMLREKVRVGV